MKIQVVLGHKDYQIQYLDTSMNLDIYQTGGKIVTRGSGEEEKEIN